MDTITLPIIQCRKCGARYTARTPVLPKTCARCRSTRWNEEDYDRIHARCPLCPWKQWYESEFAALMKLEAHILLKHGSVELKKYQDADSDTDSNSSTGTVGNNGTEVV